MKCFNCGKEVKDGLKFCTNCGVNFKDKIVYKKEVIYNDKVDGVNIANDKSAIIAIILVMVFCAFVIVMGISAVDKYKSSITVNNPVEDPIVEEEYYEFSSDSEFSFLGDTYRFNDTLGSYIDNGYTVEEIGVGDKEKDVNIKKGDFELEAIAKSNYSSRTDLRYYYTSTIGYEYNNKEITSKTIFELPMDIKIFDTYEDVMDAYGECSVRSGSLCEYKYKDDDGELRLYFDSENELIGFRILNEAK